MSVGLEGPAPYYSTPPEDTQPMSLAEYLRGALAMLAQDRAITPDEMQEIKLFMAGVEMIGQQRLAQQGAQVQPGDGTFQPGETEDANAGGPGTEVVDDSMPGEEPY